MVILGVVFVALYAATFCPLSEKKDNQWPRSGDYYTVGGIIGFSTSSVYAMITDSILHCAWFVFVKLYFGLILEMKLGLGKGYDRIAVCAEKLAKKV
ncbi:LOW QUALITY PROTEIN: hypothetical protein ColTof4_08387 [Colletotrichum tofieldiae]|nr:LOW QUALITY PROTEIN: hypothetical protein ColTof3_02094 [Colletotrichum tofieldiae]GKT75964.1 LOW QUALITY PROTEIN: hypothetical protein ColTof4_08387 [Colletotrichum tofieldiae]GKT83674.1 LOW QUALITY PROTEIN: hypothetical protein Ct61P_01524 [Colletotrichum tofieldiae]